MALGVLGHSPHRPFLPLLLRCPVHCPLRRVSCPASGHPTPYLVGRCATLPLTPHTRTASLLTANNRLPAPWTPATQMNVVRARTVMGILLPWMIPSLMTSQTTRQLQISWPTHSYQTSPSFSSRTSTPGQPQRGLPTVGQRQLLLTRGLMGQNHRHHQLGGMRCLAMERG